MAKPGTRKNKQQPEMPEEWWPLYHLDVEEVTPTVSELLAYGNEKEVRREIETIWTFVNSDQVIEEPWKSWLAKALFEISRGADANKALGLKRKKKRSVGDLTHRNGIVKYVTDQGFDRDTAMATASQFNLSTRKFDLEETGGSLKKAIDRYLEEKFGTK